MTDFSVDRAAADLVEARRTRLTLSVARPGPETRAEAFAVQDRVAASLGPAAAWKVGGGESCAPIAGSLVRASPSVWSSNELVRIGIEAEIAVRFAHGLPAGATPPDAETIKAAITSVHSAIELVDSRFDTWPVPNPLWALADNQNNGGLVYSAEGRPYEGQDLSRATVRLTVDGKAIFDGTGANPAGDPIPLLVWLAGHLAEGRGGLPPGTIVTMGSLSGLEFVSPGARIRAEIGDLPPVEVSVLA